MNEGDERMHSAIHKYKWYMIAALSIVIILAGIVFHTVYKSKSQEGNKVETSLKKVLDKKESVRDVTVAIVDSGITMKDETNDRVLHGIDITNTALDDSHGHGTDMADIILDNTDERVKVLPIKVATDESIRIEDVIKGMNSAIDSGVDIINLSLLTEVNSLESEQLKSVIRKATDKGIAVVVPAGNNGTDVTGFSPADMEEPIVVSALNEDNTMAAYSNYGDTVDVCEYGTYNENAGTSYSAAKVSATVATMLEKGMEDIDAQIIKYGERGKQEKNADYGYGFLGMEMDGDSFTGERSELASNGCDIGAGIMKLDWKSMDDEMFNAYLSGVSSEYAGMFLSTLSEEELELVKEKASVVTENTTVSEYVLNTDTMSYEQTESHEENFIDSSIEKYNEVKDKMNFTGMWLADSRVQPTIYVSDSERKMVVKFTFDGLADKTLSGSYGENMLPQNLIAHRYVVKSGDAKFTAPYISKKIDLFSAGIMAHEVRTYDVTGPYISTEEHTEYIGAGIDTGEQLYGVAITFDGIRPNTGYHFQETNINVVKYTAQGTDEPAIAYDHLYRKDGSYVGLPGIADKSQVLQSNMYNFSSFKSMKLRNIWYDTTIYYPDGTMKNKTDNPPLRYVYRRSDESSFDTKNGTMVLSAELMYFGGSRWWDGSCLTTESDVPEYKIEACANNFYFNFNANGGGGSMQKQRCTYDNKETLWTNEFSRDGYTFAGWNTRSDGSGKWLQSGDDVTNYTSEHDKVIQLYAQWKRADSFLYYTGNGATDGKKDIINRKNALETTSTKYLSSNTYTKSGAEFNDWVEYPNGIATKRKADSLVGKTYSLTTINTVIDTRYALDLYQDKPRNGTKIESYFSSGNTAQKWSFEYAKTENGKTYWYIRNTHNGKVLDLADPNIGSKTQVNINTCDYENGQKRTSQLWTMETADNGNYYIVNYKDSTSNNPYCLTLENNRLDGGNIVVTRKTGANNQKWKLWDGSKTLYAQWKAPDNTKLTINHYVMNTSGQYDSKPTKTGTKTVPNKVAFTLSDYVDDSLLVKNGIQYDCGKVDGKTVTTYTSNGNTTINLYYKRVSHKVTYDVATHKGNWPDKSNQNKVITLLYGQSIDLNSYKGMKDNWEFSGWNTSMTAIEPLKQLTMGTQDVTVYAIYCRTLTATFIDAAGVRKESTTIYNTTTSGTVNVPSERSCTWDNVTDVKSVGWNDSPTEHENKITESKMTLTADCTYYGIYSAMAKISYDVTSGSDVIIDPYEIMIYKNAANMDKTFGEKIKLAAAVKHTKEKPGYIDRYEQISWAENSIDGKQYVPESEYNLTQNTVMYAIWKGEYEAISYKIHFDPNGGTGTMDDVVAYYDQAQALPKCVYERSNESGKSTFLGWSRNQDAKEPEFLDQETVINLTKKDQDVITMYAIWDDCPILKAEDLYFSVDEVQTGKVTEEILLSKSIATDDRDINIQDNVKVLNYDADEWKQFKKDGSSLVTLTVQDSSNNKTQCDFTVHIVDTTSKVIQDPTYVRSINQKFYQATADQGGLENDSIWKSNPEYAATLKSAMDNRDSLVEENVSTTVLGMDYTTKKAGSISRNHTYQTWVFSQADIQEIKNYVNEHGIGNTKEPAALQGFLQEFNRCKQ